MTGQTALCSLKNGDILRAISKSFPNYCISDTISTCLSNLGYMSATQFSTYSFHTYSNPLCLHPKEKTIWRKRLTILCRFTRKFMLSSWRKALAYWSYWKGQEKGRDMKSPTPYSCLSNHTCFSVKLPRHSHKVKKPSVHFLFSHSCFQSHKSKPILIPIPL